MIRRTPWLITVLSVAGTISQARAAPNSIVDIGNVSIGLTQIDTNTNTKPTDGNFTVQLVPFTVLSDDAVAAAEANSIFAVSTEHLLLDLQIWEVDFTGDLWVGRPRRSPLPATKYRSWPRASTSSPSVCGTTMS